jgi:hypothetical protein
MNSLHAEEAPSPHVVLVPSPLLGPYSWSPVRERTRRAGWPTRYPAAGHSHQLVDPSGVADALVELLAACRVRGPRRETATTQNGATT